MAEDTIKSLGHILNDDYKKDAVHIAVAPVVAGTDLNPGEHVGFDKAKGVVITGSKKLIGIVDPFLPKEVKKGENFWLFLYPGSITSLRHEWTHPQFEENIVRVKGRNSWIEAFAYGVGLNYNELMEGAKDYLEKGEYLSRGDLLEGEYVPDRFWSEYEITTGEIVPEEKRDSFFSCSC